MISFRSVLCRRFVRREERKREEEGKSGEHSREKSEREGHARKKKGTQLLHIDASNTKEHKKVTPIPHTFHATVSIDTSVSLERDTKTQRERESERKNQKSKKRQTLEPTLRALMTCVHYHRSSDDRDA